MPPPSSATMRGMVSQFVTLTGETDRQANRFLKMANYKLNEAIDAYYSSQGDLPNPIDAQLDSVFDTLKDEKDEKDTMELESTMRYLTSDLKVNIENAELFVAIELLQSPSIGEISRKGFIEGWKRTGASTVADQARYTTQQVAALSSDPALFKKVYRYAFVGGREKDQKALGLDNALIYWNMLFSPPGMAWKTRNHNWLELWKEFLGEKWTRSVNKDMWNMVLEFAVKSMDDESLSFWSEDGAWPSVIDDFVEWCKAKGIARVEAMDVDGEQ